MKQIDQEKILTTMIELAHDGILLLDPHGIIIQANLVALSICGFKSMDDIRLQPIKFTDLFDLYDLCNTEVPLEQQPVSQALDGKSIIDFKCRSIRKNTGKEGYWLFSAIPMFDETKNITRVVLSIKDITFQHESEKTLFESEEQLRLTFIAGNIGFYNFDIPSGRAKVSPEYETILEYKPGEIKFITLDWWTNSIHPDDRREARSILDDCISGKSQDYKMEFRMQTKRSGWKWILCRGKIVEYDKQGKPIRLLGTHTDMTERKRTEETLRESEYFFRESQIAAIIGSYKLDFSTGYWKSSEVLDQIFGINPDYNKNIQGWLDIVHPDDRGMMDNFLRETVASKHRMFRKEYRIIRSSDGIVRWVDGSGRIAFDNHGTIISMLGTIQDITERKMAEKTLREERDKLTTIAATLPVVICSYRLRPDGSTCIPYASPAYLDIMGFSPEEVAMDASGIIEHTHPDDSESVKESIAESSRNLSPWRREYRYIHPVKGEIWIEGHSVPRREADGGTIWHGFVNDITKRKRAEEALRLSEEKFSKAFMTSPDSITISRLADGVFIEINNGSMEIFGYTREEMIGHASLPNDLNIWVNVDDRGRMVAFLNATGEIKAFETLFRRKDGSTIYGILSARIIKMNGTDYILATIHDITEQKRAEEALKHSEEKFSKAFMTSPDALAITRISDGVFIEINNGSLEIFGYSREEMIGHSSLPGDLNIWINEDDRDRMLQILKTGGEVKAFETRFQCKDGRIRNGMLSARIIKMNEEDYILTITRDITEQKRAEEARDRLTRELRALSSCNQALIRAENEQSLLDKICNIVCEIAGYRLAWVGFIVNKETPFVRVVSLAGTGESFIANEVYTLTGIDETPIDTAMRSKKSCITTDFANTPGGSLWSDYALKNGCRSAIALPLLDDTGNALGILAIYSGETNVFEAEEIKLLGELAGDLSFGIVSLRTRVERKLAQKDLIYQKELSDALLEATPGINSVIDHDGHTIRMNQNLMKYYGLTRETFTSQDPMKFIYKDDREMVKRDNERIPVVGHVEADIRFEFKPGEITWWNVIGHAVTVSGTVYIIAAGFDITSRKRMEENLQNALKEKEVLLQELYHRTKNNMQVISSYLALQAAILEDEKLQSIFNEMENRIRAMALVHEKLYKSKDLTNVDLQDYLGDLSKLLFAGFPGASDKVTLDCEIEKIFVTIDIAIPIGLVVTELITNSLKYAFPGDRSGKIYMQVRKHDQGELELHISDNGIGAPGTFDFKQKSSLGIPTVLSIMQKQLRGSVKLDTSGGFKWEIIFRTNLYAKRV